MALAFIGKVLITVSLCFQAYILFSDANVIQTFNKQLQTVLTSCDCIPPNITALLQQYFRYIIIGLLACSSLMTISRSSFFKILVLFGLFLCSSWSMIPLRQLINFLFILIFISFKMRLYYMYYCSSITHEGTYNKMFSISKSFLTFVFHLMLNHMINYNISKLLYCFLLFILYKYV